MSPVHIEHVERSALENNNNRTVTIAMVHRAMHPGQDIALSYSERQDILDDHFVLPQDATDEELLEAQNERPLGPSNAPTLAPSPPKWTMAPHLHHDKALLRKKFRAQLVKWRHFQNWHKNKKHGNFAQSWTERGPLTFRDGFGWIMFAYIGLYGWLVVIPGIDLLQLLNQ